MFEKLRQWLGAAETEPEACEPGEEIALIRDPVTGELRELRPDEAERREAAAQAQAVPAQGGTPGAMQNAHDSTSGGERS